MTHEPTPVWLDGDAADAAAFERLVTRGTRAEDHPLAATVEKGIPIYDGVSGDRTALTAEWARAMSEGPGIVVIRGAVDRAAADRATEVFERMIEEERETGAGGGDHFAKPGANDRVWNALGKHAAADPEGFVDYYGAEALGLVSEAWLGPGFQMTAQVNRVNPGGAAQVPHRDYHLGFMDPSHAARFPAQAHRLSPFLTLQGGIAHCDMDAAMGPTMLLPHSQCFEEGYVAFGRPDFQEVFERHHVQLPLETGDALFFNPAVMHGAGTNRSDRPRMVNLLQVSSAMGRSIETVDRDAAVLAILPVLASRWPEEGARRALACAAEGYAYPTNLDRDPPAEGSLAPHTPYELTERALESGDATLLAEVLAAAQERRRA